MKTQALLVCLLVAAGLAALWPVPSAAQDRSLPATLRNATEGCRKIGYDLKERCPSVCGHSIHWLVAVDVSGSMAGGRLDAVKGILRDWATYVTAPGDKGTLLLFDNEVRVITLRDVAEDRSPFVHELLDPISVRPERKGTTLQQARERLLELAAQADRSEPNHVVVAMLFSDRDDPDHMPRNDSFTTGLQRRFAGQFAWREGAAKGDKIEGETPLDLVAPGTRSGTIQLVWVSSVARRGPTTPAGGGARSLPLMEPVVNRSDTTDPYAGIRAFLRVLPLVLFLVFVGTAVWLWLCGRAGRLDGGVDYGQTSLPWRPVKAATADVWSSQNAKGFRLVPLRKDFDAVVMRAAVPGWWRWGQWDAHLTSIYPYDVDRDREGRLETAVISPGAEHELKAYDSSGPVGAARVRFKPDVTTHRVYRTAVVLLAAAVLTAVLIGPVMQAALPPPPQAIVTTVTTESLCQ